MKILSKALALGLVLAATPVGAQDASTDTSPQPSCFGNLCSGDTTSVIVLGGVTRAGTSGAMFDAGEHGIGEAGASSDGDDSVDLSLYVNTCSENCADNKIEGMLTGRQQNQSYAWATGDQSGQPIIASTLGVSGVVVEFAAGNDACPTGCGAVDSGSDGIGGEH